MLIHGGATNGRSTAVIASSFEAFVTICTALKLNVSNKRATNDDNDEDDKASASQEDRRLHEPQLTYSTTYFTNIRP